MTSHWRPISDGAKVSSPMHLAHCSLTACLELEQIDVPVLNQVV